MLKAPTPEILKALGPLPEMPNWLIWKAGPVDPKTGKFTKYPYNVFTGVNATGTHGQDYVENNCTTLDKALKAARKHNAAGVGFVVAQGQRITAIDVDGCLNGSGDPGTVVDIVEQFDSYTEVSPSGKGLRIFALGELPQNANTKKGKFENYDKNRMLTVTFNVYGELRSVVENQSAINWYVNNFTGYKTDQSISDNDVQQPTIDPTKVLQGTPEGNRDNTLFKYACRLRNQNMTWDEAKALVLIAAQNCEPAFPQDQAIKKLKSAWKYKPGETPKENPVFVPTGFNAADLLKMEFPEPKWAVPDLIPEGLSILAGKPKSGKSIMANNISLAISLGGKALSKTDVDQGSVIYLALEDTGRRLQNRLQTMLAWENSPMPDKLTFFTEFPKMGDGGLTLLEKEMESRKDLRLVVIDTFALFRPRPKGSNGAGYQEDYDHAHRIKKLADKYQVGILLIHHLRKMEAEDVFDQMSGTLGLPGAADGLLALVKKNSDNTLHVKGRDIEEVQYAVKLETSILTWELLGQAQEVQTTEYKQKVLDCLKETTECLGPKEIADITEVSINYVKKILPLLVKERVVVKQGRGQYAYMPF